jgi:dipeptidyl aminopeptidase/acylaminoacyl peptidase
MNPLNYVSRIDVPLLMLNGEYDTILNYEHSAKPMAELVATPPQDLRLRAYPTDHIPPKAEYVKEILDWLDKHFGPPH